MRLTFKNDFRWEMLLLLIWNRKVRYQIRKSISLQFDSGVRLPSAVTSPSSPPRDRGSVWTFSSSPQLQLNSAAIKKKKIKAFDSSRCWQRCCMGLVQTFHQWRGDGGAKRSGWAEGRAGGKKDSSLLCLCFRGLVRVWGHVSQEKQRRDVARGEPGNLDVVVYLLEFDGINSKNVCLWLTLNWLWLL